MHYINPNRKLGLSGLMRVKNDAQTLACSIDSCIDALDELIITYNDCTDDSPRIIEEKRQQYPDKIIVIPYPYHIYGVDASEEEYEYAKTLPIGHPQLLASYYNNALQYVNYKYVMKIDADQVYFTQKLKSLRDDIVNGIKQNKLAIGPYYVSVDSYLVSFPFMLKNLEMGIDCSRTFNQKDFIE